MDLAIDRDEFAAAIDQNGGIVELAFQVRMAFDDAATVDEHRVLTRLLLQYAHGRACERLSRLVVSSVGAAIGPQFGEDCQLCACRACLVQHVLSLIHISEPTRLGMISYAVFCL